MADDAGAAAVLSKSAYARHRGVSAAMVSHWTKAGRLVLVDGKVDVAKSDAALAATLAPDRGGKGGVPASRGTEQPAPVTPTGAFTEHRASRESFNAKEAELDYLERVGKLVERERYDRALTDALAPVMAALDRMAPTLGPLVTGETDARKVQNLIDDAVDGIRRDMESTIRAMLAGPGTRQ
ncbi:MAG: hypothetical protein ABI624_20380 [Casimicrobiaceae bacterium]